MLEQALLFSFLAGLAIPAGGLIAAVEHIQPAWLEQEFRHSMISLGGGALLAAVCLVLVPEGLQHLPITLAGTAFFAGGMFFLWADRLIERQSGSAAMLMAMLLDYIPEAIAMGAIFASSVPKGAVLALLIGMQNLPEGFNAYRELMARHSAIRGRLLRRFFLLSAAGPLAAWLGMTVFSEQKIWLAVLMLFCAGGILYLTFQDIAPQAKLERAWAPPLGAVAGFLIGLIGYMVIGL
jgi:ZIP family zinc transporter